MNFRKTIGDIFEANQVVDHQGRHVSSVDLDDDPELNVGPEVDFPTQNKPDRNHEVVEPFKDEQEQYELDKKTITPDKLTALKNIRAANINNNLTDLSTVARKHLHQYLIGQTTKAQAEKSVDKVATVANAINKVVGTSNIDKVPKSAAKNVFDDEDPDEHYDEILKHEMHGIGRELKRKDLKGMAAKAKKWDELQANDQGIEGFNPFDEWTGAGADKETVDLGDNDIKTSPLSTQPGNTEFKFDGTEFRDEADKQAYKKNMAEFEKGGADVKKTGMMDKFKNKFRNLLRRESTEQEFDDLVFDSV